MIDFNLNNAADQEGYGPIPKGTYNAVIEKVEDKTTKAGNKAVNLQFKIKGPSHQNRVIFSWVNLEGSKQAEDISAAFLKTINLALDLSLNKGEWKFSDYIGKVMGIEVGVKVQEYNGETQNVNVIYRALKPSTVSNNAPTSNPAYSGSEIPF